MLQRWVLADRILGLMGTEKTGAITLDRYRQGLQAPAG
jgi:hypothetical protein